MGLGIWRKIKEGFKKAGAWIKNKAVPWLKNKGIGIAKTVWGAAKPFVGMLPAGGAITTAIDTGLGIGEKLINTANDFANTGNVNNAVQQVKETVSPFIKLKKGGGGNAPVMGIGINQAFSQKTSMPPFNYNDVAI